MSGSASAATCPPTRGSIHARSGGHVLRLRGEPLHQVVTRLGGHLSELVERRPGPLGVHVVRRQRGDTTPVVHPRRDQRQAFGPRHQIRRRLHPHLGAQHQPGDRDRGQELLEIGVGHGRHRGVVLGAEVLHDHFLHMPELAVRAADRVDRIRPFQLRLADADQQPGGERDRQPPRIVEGAQPHRRVLVGAAVVGQTLRLVEPPRRRLQHHAHRRRHGLEPGQLRPAHHPRVEVWQQPGLLQHPDRHRPHVIEGRVVAAFVEPLTRLLPARLRPIPQREKSFLATQLGTLAGHREDLVGFHEHALALRAEPARHRDESAVVAGVAAQMRHRNEHLARIAHRQAPVRTAPTCSLQTGITHPGRTRHQIGQIGPTGRQRDRSFVDVQRHPVPRAPQHSPQRGRRRGCRGGGHRGIGQIGAALGVQSHSRITPASTRIIRASHMLKPVRVAYRPQ